MQRDQSPSGAVIMHDQIVNPGDIIIRENDVVNLLYQFRLGGLPKQGTDRVFGCDKSGVQDEHTHQHTTVTVDNDARGGRDDSADENHGGCYHIAQTVNGGSLHCHRTDPGTDAAVIQSHIALYQDRKYQDADNDRGVVRNFRMENLTYRAFYQFEAHEHD